jgi:hypothetical protein
LKDLKPYVCILEECGEPAATFSSFRKWLEHMEFAHSREWTEMVQRRKVWYCDVDSLSYEEFLNATELEQHVKTAHGGKVPAVVLASMLEDNVLLSSGDPRICPLCYEAADKDDQKLASADENSGAIRRRHASHIAKHLKALAFLSMRNLKDADSGDLDDPSQPLKASNDHQKFADVDDSVVVQWPDASHTEDPDGRSELHAEDMSVPKGKSPEPETWSLRTDQSSESPKSRKPTTLRVLRRLIRESKVESPFDAQTFFPRGYFNKLITPENIRAALDNPPGETVEFIEQKAKVFFTILVSMRVDLSLAIGTLQRFNLTDEFLPIPKESVDDNCEEDDSDRSCKHAPELNALHNEPWDYGTLSDLYDKQWEFLAPVFTTQHGHKGFKLPAKSILPFIYLGVDRKSSFYGDVYEIKIHPDHQDVLPQVRATGTQYR